MYVFIHLANQTLPEKIIHSTSHLPKSPTTKRGDSRSTQFEISPYGSKPLTNPNTAGDTEPKFFHSTPLHPIALSPKHSIPCEDLMHVVVTYRKQTVDQIPAPTRGDEKSKSKKQRRDGKSQS
ncbi:hypothetical protein ACMFMG_005176 [Clarireedia jacksonii]